MPAISRTGRLLRGLFAPSRRRPRLTLLLSLLFAALGVAYTLHGLTFKTSMRALLPQNARYVPHYEKPSRAFGGLEDIVVGVGAGSSESARAYASRLTQELRASPVKFHRIA